MQQHGSKYFALRPHPSRPRGWSKRSKFNFFRTWSCCISIKGYDECSNMQAHILSFQTLSRPLGWGQGQKYFAESIHISYQIIVIHASTYSIITHTLGPEVGSKYKSLLLLKVFMFHIKLKQIENRALCKHIFCPYKHNQPPDGSTEK